jgi:hypothetical protein
MVADAGTGHANGISGTAEAAAAAPRNFLRVVILASLFDEPIKPGSGPADDDYLSLPNFHVRCERAREAIVSVRRPLNR